MSPSEASGKVGTPQDVSWWVERLKQQEALTDAQFQRAEAAEARARELAEAIHNLSATYDGIWIRISDGEAYALNVAWNKIYAALAARQASAKGGE